MTLYEIWFIGIMILFSVQQGIIWWLIKKTEKLECEIMLRGNNNEEK